MFRARAVPEPKGVAPVHQAGEPGAAILAAVDREK